METNYNIYNFIIDNALRKPEQIILNSIYENKKITAQELYTRSEILASALHRIGIKKGDRVVMLLPSSIALYITFCALNKLGVVTVLFESWVDKKDIFSALLVVRPSVIISFESAFQMLSLEGYYSYLGSSQENIVQIIYGPHSGKYDYQLEDWINLENDIYIKDSKWVESFELAPTAKINDKEVALISFTTGSSGNAKGVKRTHKLLRAQHAAIIRHTPFMAGDIDFSIFPVFLLNSLAAGIESVIPFPNLNKIDNQLIPNLIKWLRDYKITTITANPHFLKQLLECLSENPQSLPSVRRMAVGGAPVNHKHLFQIQKYFPNADILIFYGSTEIEPISHISVREINLHNLPLLKQGTNLGPIDKELRYKILSISDLNNNKIFLSDIVNSVDITEIDNLKRKAMEVGELILSGEHVCENYFLNDEAFKKTKILDNDGTLWHRTGDIGFIDAEKNFWLTGRTHQLITRQGKKYFPIGAENLVHSLLNIQKCAYIGLSDPYMGEKILVVITAEANYRGKREELLLEVEEILNKNDITFDEVIVMDEIPVDPRHQSKILVSKLKEELVNYLPAT